MRNLILLFTLFYGQLLYSQSCFNITATDIFENPSATLSCGTGSCIELTTKIPQTFFTDSYNVAPQAYAPVVPFNQGTLLNPLENDMFSGVIPLPFNFCFYGGTYSNIVISNNGFITFDTELANIASNPRIWASIPSNAMPRNSIYGVMQDITFENSPGSNIYYTVIGTAPCRKFIINFYKPRIAGCTDTSTSQIVLSEFSNEIDIIVENKPLPCTTSKFKESLIGINNIDGTEGLSPPDKNSGIWQCGNESWKYTPAGAMVEPIATWTNAAGQIVGTTATINACPTKSDKYKVTLDYRVCGTSFLLSDDIDITYNQTGSNTPVVSIPPYSATLCDNNADNTEVFDFQTQITPTIVSDSPVTVRYYTTRAAAEAGGPGITNIRGGNYDIYVRATNGTGCYVIAILKMSITFLDKVEARDLKKLYCFDGKQNFAVNLNDLYPEMLITPPSKITKVRFYKTLEDATIPTDLSEDANQFLTKDGNLVQYVFFVRFENADGCFTIKRLTIELRNPITDPNQNICDFRNDGAQTVTLATLNGAVIGSQPVTASYFPDAPSANANTGAITSFQLDAAGSPGLIYVRLDMVADNGNCYRVYPVTLTLIPSPFLSKEVIDVDLGQICDNNNDGSEPIDLNQFQKQIYSGPELFAYSYYLNYNPSTGAFSNKISNIFLISSNTVVYARVSRGACFTAAQINIRFSFLPAVIVKPGTIDQCDNDNKAGEIYNMNNEVSSMFPADQNTDALRDIKVTFYKTSEDANRAVSEEPAIQTIIANKETFWARFQSKNTNCYSVMPIYLVTHFPPKTVASTIIVCDNNLDGNPDVNLTLPQYTVKMLSEPVPGATFRFYLTPEDIAANRPIQNPENFSPKPFPSTIYVVSENIAGCYSLPAVPIFFESGNQLIVKKDNFVLEDCDSDNDGIQTLDLSQFENEMYNSTASYSYYPTLNDLYKNTNIITSPAAYNYNSKAHPPVVFVKVADAGYCPALVKINISFKKSPVFKLEPYYFCPGVGITIETDLEYLDPEEYIWRNPAGEMISKDTFITNIKTQGTYSLTIRSENKCTHTANFEVIAYEVPVITQLVGLTATSYQVIATGSRKIVYSIDGITWQDSNIFENIVPGPVTFYVRFEDSKCLGDTRDGLSVKVGNVITPNEDGYNDTWTFTNLSIFKDVPSNLKIYDRNGIMVYEQSSTDQFIWDGKFNGRSLPTASYWYIIVLPDKTVNGWILLKNRN